MTIVMHVHIELKYVIKLNILFIQWCPSHYVMLLFNILKMYLKTI